MCLRSLIATWLLLASAAPILAQEDRQPAISQGLDSASPPSRTALEGELREILARPDFKRAMRGGGQDPRNVGQWLILRLRQLLSQLGGLHETNYGLFVVAVTIGSVLLLALLAHIAYTVARAFRPRRRAEARPTRPARRRPTTPEALQREADDFAKRGSFREAVRLLYLALIRNLQLAGALARTSSQTNREHLSHLAADPKLAAVVRPFTEAYEEKWYGQRPANADDVARCRAWLQAAAREVEDR